MGCTSGKMERRVCHNKDPFSITLTVVRPHMPPISSAKIPGNWPQTSDVPATIATEPLLSTIDEFKCLSSLAQLSATNSFTKFASDMTSYIKTHRRFRYSKASTTQNAQTTNHVKDGRPLIVSSAVRISRFLLVPVCVCVCVSCCARIGSCVSSCDCVSLDLHAVFQQARVASEVSNQTKRAKNFLSTSDKLQSQN